MPYGFNNDKSKYDLENLISQYINTARSTFVDSIYPVGSIYMSVNNISPSNLFGGTWTQIKDTFLLAAGNNYAAGSTGGEATHTLTVGEIPSHNHNLSDDTTAHAWGWGGSGKTVYAPTPATSGNGSNNYINTKQSIWNKTANNGSGKAHNNMPPYLTVYMWKRTG